MAKGEIKVIKDIRVDLEDRAAPIMLLTLPIILSRISFNLKFTYYSKIIPNFYLLFLNYSTFYLKQLTITIT